MDSSAFARRSCAGRAVAAAKLGYPNFPMRRILAILGVLALSVPAGCGCGTDGGSADLTIYSGRDKDLIGPLLDRYAEEKDVDIEVRYGGTPELAATIAEEGDRSPADVFLSQDAG